MARLKKYMYKIDDRTIGFKWWWVLYCRIKFYFLSSTTKKKIN